MNRGPALLLVLAMLAGLIVLERSAGAEAEEITTQPAQGPTAADPSASGSTWFCPAGFVAPDGSADHVVIVTNQTDDDIVGTLTLYPSLLDSLGNPVPFDRAAQPIEISARSQQRISLAPLVTSLDPGLANAGGAFAAALAEFDVAGVTVEHEIVASQGRDIGACATSAGTTWWFSSGTTTADVDFQLYLLNPFPDDAVVDIAFVTDAGSRSPTSLIGKLIPKQSLTVLQISPIATVNEQMTAQVVVKTGRVVAERIQLFENEAGPSGLSLSLGSNRLAEQWFFPAGRSLPGSGESYVIYNPGEAAAEVEFEAKPDRADRVGDVAPKQITVGSRERWIVTIGTHATHPVDSLAAIDATTMVEPGDQFFASVRSFNGVPIVVERVITRPLVDGGVTTTLGADVAARRQSISLPDFDQGTLAILNPSGETISRVQVIAGGADGETRRARVELAPRRRAVFALESITRDDDEWIRVVSTTGTIAEITVVDGDVVLSAAAIPVGGTTSVPDLLAFD